ncbi:hypothetical protein [Candidatus Rhabdochlamydia sp. T3358]|uniref:hypothetical protein n=1 Tax=Candidatus Rhabdochlamydia sp. T3358 TaxID=2099795 RepID=UPI0010B4E416|nr:hypothetical protein [Candidatus Rhabdochlamydia sp. T3358]VHO04728.1 hypothetical protein RHT_01488 [Candidatus Rhabdochlamydia sp. T3358]
MFSLVVFSFAFGVLTKLADLFNEHGLREPFKGSAILAGISWGVVGMGLIYFNPSLRIFYTALVFYWLLSMKLDYKNHAIGGLIVILSSVKICSFDLSVHILEIIVILFAYEVTRYLQSVIKNGFIKRTIELRLYIIPCFYSLYTRDYSVFIAALIAISGIKFINKFFLIKKSHMVKKL